MPVLRRFAFNGTSVPPRPLHARQRARLRHEQRHPIMSPSDAGPHFLLALISPARSYTARAFAVAIVDVLLFQIGRTPNTLKTREFPNAGRSNGVESTCSGAPRRAMSWGCTTADAT
ncbi:hypothetical protein EVAR_51396_1 [Eumeta japonica]|uniref:Uncharacterized protein n=1 Tax=Eumeta variegata TaxID=151549 RepID=A0A4C1ZV77_EUMVA|nr:hypothetical protein EVAR_51396_1 [Eumeta japonica]